MLAFCFVAFSCVIHWKAHNFTTSSNHYRPYQKCSRAHGQSKDAVVLELASSGPVDNVYIPLICLQCLMWLATNTYLHACLFMRTIPGCPLCNSPSTASWPCFDTTTQLPRSKHPSCAESSYLWFSYSWRVLSTASGHPKETWVLTRHYFVLVHPCLDLWCTHWWLVQLLKE